MEPEHAADILGEPHQVATASPLILADRGLRADVIEDARAAEVEAVRAYLVAARGGAPFLSGADGVLLLSWLERGVPVPAILSAIDKVSQQRRKRPVKSRLSLSALRKHLDRWAPGPSPTQVESPAAPAQDGAWSAFLALVLAGPAPEDLAEPWERLALRLRGIVPDAPPQARAEQAITASRLFFEEAWVADPLAQAALLEQARTSLAALEAGLPPALFRELQTEAARSILRDRFPQLGAGAIWDRFCPGGAA
jgi:hypothetical protein